MTDWATMYISLGVTIGGLTAVLGYLYRRWSTSGWKIDRRSALAKIDRFMDDLNALSEDFPEISSELNLPKLNDGWMIQRAGIVKDGSFTSWLAGGCPSRTLDNPKAEALFRFARSQAQPLSYSIYCVDDTPSQELLGRIEATVDPRSGQFKLDSKYVRLVQPSKVLDPL